MRGHPLGPAVGIEIALQASERARTRYDRVICQLLLQPFVHRSCR